MIAVIDAYEKGLIKSFEHGLKLYRQFNLVTHHIDGDTSNNDISNLEGFLKTTAHYWLNKLITVVE